MGEMSELGPEDRQRLLDLARAAIEARLRGRPRPEPELGARLREPCGAFVTLRSRPDHDLRGCVGYIQPSLPLAESVAHAALAAALEDTRFTPVTLEELPKLSLEISVLSPLAPIRPEQVRVGVHGLVLRHRGHSGLLLPQVPVEHGWDRETFLDHTCRKAGLDAGCWRHPDTKISAFTAEVFGDAEPR